MNGDFLSLAAQSLNTAVMNLLIFLYCRKTEPPPPKSKAVYMITYFLSTALFISVNRLSASLDIPIINFFFMFIYVNALSITFFKTPPKKALLYNLFCFLFLIFSDIFTVIAWSVMKGESLKAVLSNSLYVSLSCLTNIFIMIAGYSIFSVAYSDTELPSLKIRHTLLITVFCFFELFAEYNFSIRIKNRTDGIVTLIMIIGFMVVILTSVTIRMYRDENRRSQKQKEEIDALNRAQNRFFSSMSHEIRTPINTIVGLNEMILREDISDEIAEDARNIESASKMLLQLINDILDMSKLEAGEMRIIPSRYSMSDMLSELVGMFILRAKEKGLDFIVNVDPAMPSGYVGDEVRLQQIMINILNNAVKYTREGSVTLSVQCEDTDDPDVVNVIFSVSDPVIGIKKESLPYLFSAFKRVDDEGNKYVEGTGLGLSIVKQLVDMMGGEITVNSIYTQGSTFMITIPQQVDVRDEIGELDLAHRHFFNRREDYHQTFEAPEARVLVVDDNNANILVMKKLLRDTRVEIDTAESGAAALKLTGEKYYDVIFMDHLMPEMDGIECMHAIRDQVGGLCKESRIVALTANAGSDRKEFYTREGFDEYLLKPVTGSSAERMLLSMLPEGKVILINADADLLIEHGQHSYARNKKKPLIVTSESVCDLPREYLEKYDIPIIPYAVATEEGVFLDKYEMDAKGVINYIDERGKMAKSLSPGADHYSAFFAEQLTRANNILHITMTRQLNSPSYEQASEAAKTFDNVRVIDSRNFTCGMGMIVLEAARLAAEGVPVDGVVKRLEEYMDRVQTSFVVDSLDYMTRAGRLHKVFASLTDAFMVHPALALNHGKLVIRMVYLGSSRNTWKRYIRTMLYYAKRVDTRVLFVEHSGISREDQEFIRSEIERHVRFSEIVFVSASASITTNCGPGSIGLSYITD